MSSRRVFDLYPDAELGCYDLRVLVWLSTQELGGSLHIDLPYRNVTAGTAMPDSAHLRDRMVKVQLACRGIREPVLSAMRQVPREQFVEAGFEEFAYEDGALPIPNKQTISQPYIVALMIEAAELRSTESVLEVGTGSGYAAAIASRLAGTVHTIERHEALAAVAAK